MGGDVTYTAPFGDTREPGGDAVKIDFAVESYSQSKGISSVHARDPSNHTIAKESSRLRNSGRKSPNCSAMSRPNSSATRSRSSRSRIETEATCRHRTEKGESYGESDWIGRAGRHWLVAL